MFQDAKRKRWISSNMLWLGKVTKDPKEATKLFEDGILLAEEINSVFNQIYGHYWLGVIKMNKGSINEALDDLQQSKSETSRQQYKRYVSCFACFLL